MKKLIALVLALVCVLCLSACDGKAGKDFGKADDLHQFGATILEIHDDCFLVEPSAGMDELKSADKIEVSTQNADKSIDWKVGDLVLITYDGVILESYPARLGQVYKVEQGILKLTEKETQSGGSPADEAFDITVSYANWCELNGIYAKALNAEKMNISCVRHLPIYRFDTLAELEQFKTDFKDVLSVDAGYEEIPSFSEASAKYDENFFVENTLMLVYVVAGSDSYRYGVDSVYHADGNFCIHVKQTNNPAVVTDNMLGWFITVAVPDNMIESCTEFDADLTKPEDIDEESPLVIVSNGENISPYLHLVNSKIWDGQYFITADGAELSPRLEELETNGYIPHVEYSHDFGVVLADGVTVTHILLYNDAFEQLDTVWGISDLSKLNAGHYYIGIVVRQDGDYIAEANEYEGVGLAGVVRLIIK